MLSWVRGGGRPEPRHAFLPADGGFECRWDAAIGSVNNLAARLLSKGPMNRWMPAYLEALKTAKQELGYQEGAQVEAVLGLKLNQALIGELSSARALNQAAQEIKAIFEKSGRKTVVGVALGE